MRLQAQQNGKVRYHVACDPEDFFQPERFPIKVVVNRMMITVWVNRYDNAITLDPDYFRCCGRLKTHDVKCRKHSNNKRKVNPPPPAREVKVKYPDEEAARRREVAKAAIAAAGGDISHNGKLAGPTARHVSGEKAEMKLCQEWINNVTGCSNVRCKWFPCVGLRVGHAATCEVCNRGTPAPSAGPSPRWGDAA